MRAYVEGLQPGAVIRPGLLSNPMARTNWRSVAHERLVRRMPSGAACISTPAPRDVHGALEEVLFERRTNVLAINGGDGTIHHTLNVALQVVGRASEILGEPVPLPRFLFLNGGGMNMLARTFHTRGHPLGTMGRFLKMARRGRLGDIPTRQVPLLEVREPSGSTRHGFIFGSEMVLNALTMYERFGQGYRGLTRFLAEVTTGYAFQTEMWKRFGHLARPPVTSLEVDGCVHERYAVLVASTVPMTLLKGLVVAVRRPARPGTFESLTILQTDTGRLLALMPTLMRAGTGAGILRRADTRSALLRGPFTLDGELVTKVPGDDGGVVRVCGSQIVIDGVWMP